MDYGQLLSVEICGPFAARCVAQGIFHDKSG
jgi:hypothetical protein